MDINSDKQLFIEADIDLIDGTDELRKEAASIIDLPKADDRQPDLQYFSAIFVSTGTNLNHAHFMSSELLSAAKSIPMKAVDVEHNEDDIIGHILDYAFIDMDNKKLSVAELVSMDKEVLDSTNVHIVISGVLYKSRFPKIAKEMADGEWKVSMEAYYQDYDLKIGSLILDKKEATMLGYDSSSLTGKIVRVVKKGIVLASGEVTRVLRGILFSGVGIVKNPANPPSVVLETATQNTTNTSTDIANEKEVVLDYDCVVEKANNYKISNVTMNSDTDIEITVDNKGNKDSKVTKNAEGTISTNTTLCSLFNKDRVLCSELPVDADCGVSNSKEFVTATTASKHQEDLLVKLENKISKALNVL